MGLLRITTFYGSGQRLLMLSCCEEDECEVFCEESGQRYPDPMGETFRKDLFHFAIKC